MSDTPDRNEMPTMVPTRITALSRGRSELADRLFRARSRRRALIRDIEDRTQRVLLCYVSEGPQIEQADALHLEALLQRVEPEADITVLLNSPGGDVDAAEKLLHMLTEAVAPSGSLDVVVPNAAKSAATIIALGAHELTMSDTSELGPIDPQLELREGNSVHFYPVAAFLKAYRDAERRCAEHPDNQAFREAFLHFDFALMEQLRMAETRARQIAERIAIRHGWNHTLVADRLMDTNRFPSHGQMIDWRTALEIGLENVRYMPRTDHLWRMYWQLYRSLRAVVGDQKKVLESREVTRLT